DFNLNTGSLPQVDEVLAEERREQLVALSRNRYATPKAEVEALLAKQRQAPEPEPVPKEKETGKEKTAKEKRSEETDTVRSEPFTVKPEPSTGKQPKPTPGQPPPLGKGGAQHKFLQRKVKSNAEKKGFRATIEKPVLRGTGSIDVVLEKEDKKYACEISINTTAEQELGNIQKCLAAGYETVFVISPEKKTLNNIRQLVATSLEQNEIARIRYVDIEDFLRFLEEEADNTASTELIVGGRKVRKKLRPLPESERKERRKAIAKTILQALGRIKDN